MLINVLTLGMIFSILSLGVHISYKQLNFPDLSVDGSLPLGASLCAAGLTIGLPLPLCLLLSLTGGLLAGAITGLLHTRLHLSDLLAGILVMIALYSLNLRIMGRPNLPLIGYDHPFQGPYAFLAIGIVLMGIRLGLSYFSKTHAGMMLVATGENPDFVLGLGLDPRTYKCLGLMISNALVSLSGALLALNQGFADVGMGLGMMVAGLASVIIGEKIFNSVILGSLMYRGLIALAFSVGVSPGDIKLLTAVLMILILSPVLKKPFTQGQRRFSHAQLFSIKQVLFPSPQQPKSSERF